ncbi:hypothetical protein PHYBLDRAFT_170619 [Phycomyces blakesleeanus NRRL 1555(-)]|uniref:Uncharacterized protein n=1 Tax=Phycomyces blakesleeanus (strain ATCC 8743b / DSM 1359 / FGSC 10004 / NBRC 33097 / NRRL 1555) TaxID=763407 RepID=A0A162TV59_PHYB8|nr:hypothetical protein PHYBLDRAFT_170619 [Phycomyces blakesleeanus NRRL 1555(-)]OAD71242.1 hypothetical protein PHYBLDRAFT_170619 [Phycomyces blakesleeanus NRRL 1555(-)]|eukprot:XP_018289282.1 hypothetical protein PHYBLDRAFT_170619 [Phycomyces blakesleeanus NRRL 1555(-)]
MFEKVKNSHIYEDWVKTAHLLDPVFDYISFVDLANVDKDLTNVSYLKRRESEFTESIRNQRLQVVEKLNADTSEKITSVSKKLIVRYVSAQLLLHHSHHSHQYAYQFHQPQFHPRKESSPKNTNDIGNKKFLANIIHAVNGICDELPDDLVISIDDKGINKLVKSYLGEQRFQSLESNTGLPEHSLTPPCQKLLDLINNAPPSPVVIRKIIRKSTLGDEIFNFIVHSDLNFAETTITHFLNLMMSPCNPLVHQTLERTAATFTTVTIINNLFFANNDIINLACIQKKKVILLGRFEKEVWTAGNTKWDGVALAVKDKTVAPVLIEFSGGYYVQQHGKEGEGR